MSLSFNAATYAFRAYIEPVMAVTFIPPIEPKIP